VFLYQPSCIASADFESVLNEFINSNKISIYKLTFSSIKNTEIGEKIKYYPSFMIYNKGEMVDFLESDKDEDVEYYTSKDGFTKWFTKYVKLREVDSNSISTNDNSNNDDNSNNSSDENSSIKKVRLDNVKKAKNKVNIYFFWGDGCPHCEKELEFFNSIKDKYGKYYNLHAYETWYNSSNAEIRNIFATAMGNKEKGVPYTVIGEKSFVGFGDEMKEDFIKAIVEESKKDFDVYFDKLKE
ncbi:MAG TPA: hypothetical protein DCE23_03865, partial [Firmicutes bacterium]|nr:hypothetical protein [Bacillota bacterium]